MDAIIAMAASSKASTADTVLASHAKLYASPPNAKHCDGSAVVATVVLYANV